MPTALFSCQRSNRRGSCLRNRDREGVVDKTLSDPARVARSCITPDHGPFLPVIYALNL